MSRHQIFDVNGVTIGVFGLTTPSLGRLASHDTMSHIDVLDIADVARHEVAELDPQVDLVVALTHVGIDADKALAESVDGIDLIVGGHSHTRLTRPLHVDDTWIVQTGAEGRQLGVVEFDVTAGGRISRFSGGNVDLLPDSLPVEPDPVMVGLTARWQDSIDRRFATVAGTLPSELDRKGHGETSLGRWAADIVRGAGQTDVGIYNAGGLRADLPEGEVKLGQLYEAFPFSNQVVSFEVTGDELVRLMLTTVYAEVYQKRGPLQWSGVRFTWRMTMDAPELVDIRVNGEPLDTHRSYRVATNSYVADQWEYNLGFEPRSLEGHGMTVFEAAQGAMRAGTAVVSDSPRCVRAAE